MAGLVVRVKVLPEDVEEKPEAILERIEKSTKGVATIVRHRVEPVAFGLNALVVDFGIEDREGGTDPLEAALMSTAGISQLDVLGVSRSSTSLK